MSASRLVAEHGLRAYDAVQLASAELARMADPDCRAFACFDNDLRAAAETQGFELLPAAGTVGECARNEAPAARLVSVEPEESLGRRFLASWGELAGEIWIGEDFEFTEAEIEEMFESD